MSSSMLSIMNYVFTTWRGVWPVWFNIESKSQAGGFGKTKSAPPMNSSCFSHPSPPPPPCAGCSCNQVLTVFCLKSVSTVEMKFHLEVAKGVQLKCRTSRIYRNSLWWTAEFKTDTNSCALNHLVLGLSPSFNCLVTHTTVWPFNSFYRLHAVKRDLF